MTRNILKTIAIILCLTFLHSCKDKTTGTYLANAPVYMDYDTFRNQAIQLGDVQGVEKPGKIWIKDQYLFVVDVLKGVHVFDNSNPSSPVNLGFIKIFACTDIAVKGNLLYADNYNDLLTIDISNPESPEFSCRQNDVFNFQAVNNMDGYDASLPSAGVVFSKGVITGWNQEKVTEEIGGTYQFSEWGLIDTFDSLGANTANGISSVSVGGSMARFTIADNHLYTIEERVLKTFSITGTCPEETASTSIWRLGETVFPAQDHLFIGTTTGMLIYSLDNPSNPSFVSDYPHVGSCDPVVIQNDRAYVTLRTGNRCVGDVNELVIVDVSDLTNPTEIATYDMTNPHGLGVDGDNLFLCDGSDGLKIFDSSYETELTSHMIDHVQNIKTYDVIPFNNTLIMSAAEGIYQYDYSDIENLQELSLIPVN